MILIWVPGGRVALGNRHCCLYRYAFPHLYLLRLWRECCRSPPVALLHSAPPVSSALSPASGPASLPILASVLGCETMVQVPATRVVTEGGQWDSMMLQGGTGEPREDSIPGVCGASRSWARYARIDTGAEPCLLSIAAAQTSKSRRSVEKAERKDFCRPVMTA